MTTPLTRWQTAAALAVDGACRLPYILAATVSVALALSSVNLPLLLPLGALVYGGVCAPLRLWRAAWYSRLTAAGEQLPSLRLPRRSLSAIGWRWGLWWRRGLALMLGVAPSTLIWRYGATTDAQAVVWLAVGGVALLVGVTVVWIWQTRYILAPYYILRGDTAATALALSARQMRGRRGDYLNFLGGEAARLLLCLVPPCALWVLPAFRRRRTALLLGWI